MSTTPTDAERALFEAWCLKRGGISTSRDSTPKANGGRDEYDNAWTNHAWWAWQAARSLPVDGLDAEPVQPNRDWDHIDDVLPVIELMRSGKWVWDENMRCKYVEVRIDTRDGGCIIKDRHDVRITPAELVKQFYGRGGLSWTEYDEIFSPPIAKQQEPS